MRRHLLTLASALVLSAALPAVAQEPLPWQTAPAPVVAPAPAQVVPAQVPVQIAYAVRTANIHAGPGVHYGVIGKVEAGTQLQVAGLSPVDPHWMQLTTGGFVSVSLLSPTPVVVHHHHAEVVATEPPPVNYPVGTCQPYAKVVNIAGQPPQQINGTACKQPDGTWKIVNYGVPQPVAPPATVVVQQPVVPVYPGPVYYH